MPTVFPYILTEHARKRIMQRGISLDWIVRVLENPDHEEPDAEDPELFNFTAGNSRLSVYQGGDEKRGGAVERSRHYVGEF